MNIRALSTVAVMLLMAGCIPPATSTLEQGGRVQQGGFPASGGFVNNGGFSPTGNLGAIDVFGNPTGFNVANTSGINNTGFDNSGFGTTGVGGVSNNQGFGQFGAVNSGFGQGFSQPGGFGINNFNPQGFNAQGFNPNNFNSTGFGTNNFGPNNFDPNYAGQNIPDPYYANQSNFGAYNQGLNNFDPNYPGQSGFGPSGFGRSCVPGQNSFGQYGDNCFAGNQFVPGGQFLPNGQFDPRGLDLDLALADLNLGHTAVRASSGDIQSVAVVQQLLAANGHFTGPIDGQLGPLTTQAIRSYQRQNFLPIDGHISVRLLSALAGQAVDRIPSNGNASAVESEIARVARVQRFLVQLGLEPGPADGRFGPYTRQAIKDFQVRNGVAPTGEITDDLVAALASAVPGAATNASRGADATGFPQGQDGRRRGMTDPVATQLDRPGLRSDLNIALADLSSAVSSGTMNLRFVANGRIASLGRDSEAVRLNGLLVGEETVANQAQFSFDSPMVNETGSEVFGQYDNIALSWRGFLAVRNSGQYDFVMQTDFADAANGNHCDIALMFREDRELVPVIKRRVTTTRAMDQANLFLEQGLHEVSIWVQCKEVVGVRRFRTNLLMRGPGFQLAQPIPDELMFAATDVEEIASLLDGNLPSVGGSN